MRNTKRVEVVSEKLNKLRDAYAKAAAVIVADHFDLNNYEQRLLGFSLAMDVDLAVAAAICAEEHNRFQRKKKAKR